jgi:hypothetical protein
VVLVAYCPQKKRCHFTIGAAARDAGAARLDVEDFTGQEVHTYITFINESKTVPSDSVYTGAVNVPAN